MTSTPTVAITGAAGFIGSRVLNQLQEEHPDWEIVALDNQFRGQVKSVAGTTIDHVDIRDRWQLYDLLEGSDIVLHLAAVSGVEDCAANPDLTYEVNVTGTNNIAWFCRRTGAALVFPFSVAVLGNPDEFPITANQSRNPLNWYGRTKYLNEQAIHTFAEGEFPAHLFLKTNVYGEHAIDGTAVSKESVINFFVNRAVAGESLTVYKPGTQSRNFVHVKDVGDVYVRSAKLLSRELEQGRTGVSTYEVGGSEDISIMTVAETVAALAEEELGIQTDVSLVENPREGEATAQEFTIDTSSVHEDLGWEPSRTLEESIRNLLQKYV
jgi:UDP-glucose 4-epimerase